MIKKISKIDLSKALLGAICFSAFIYLAHFDIYTKTLHSIFAIIAFYIIIHLDKKALFYLGFFVGILWFYWISLSFRYYELSFLIPIGIILVAFVYAIVFYLIAFFHPLLRFIPIFALEYIYIFDFNYLNPKLPFVYSYIATDNYSFISILLALTFLPYVLKYNHKIKTLYIVSSIVIVLSPLFLNEAKKLSKPNLDIEIVHTDISQEQKWKVENIYSLRKNNFALIQKAIKNNKDMIIFPESTFERPLNLDYETMDMLRDYSKDIAIVAGSLHIGKDAKYNSTYVFNNKEVQIIHKHILTPFGERVPFPKLITDFINNIFYDGSSDFDSAKSYGEFEIKGYIFRNAICFEATRDELYKNNPKYLIAISNNAWFAPSIQSTLQNIHLTYLSQKYGTIIYHSTNRGKNIIIGGL